MSWRKVAIVLSLYTVNVLGGQDSLNVILPPGGRECFFDNIPAGSPARAIEVFVPSGSNVDVLLEIIGPLTTTQLLADDLPKPFVTEHVNTKRQEHSESQSFTQQFEPDTPGTYAYCVDNSRSHFVPRKVQVTVRILEDDGDDDKEPPAIKPPVYHEDEEVNGRLAKYLSKMKEGLARVQQQQRVDRNRLSLNSETNRASHNSMVTDSIVETLIFILASLFQIFFVRRWFLARPAAAKKGKKNLAAGEWA